jgi:hypothetical protein
MPAEFFLLLDQHRDSSLDLLVLPTSDEHRSSLDVFSTLSFLWTSSTLRQRLEEN